MKHFFLFLNALALCALLGGCENGIPRIAVVDENRILLQSRQGRAATSRGEQLHQIMQQNLNSVESALSAYPNKDQARELLRIEINKIQLSLREGQEDIFRKIDTALARVIEEYRAKNDIILVFSSGKALGFREEIDISDAIIPLFDAVPINFSELPPLIPRPSLPAPLPE